MFSKSCEYAIKAMIYIKAYGNDSKLSLNEIAEAIDSPVAFTSKILQQLRKSGILYSTKGINGGFHIPKEESIDLKEIVIAIDGDGILTECVLGLKSCSAVNPCPLHEKYKTLKEELLNLMLNLRLEEFSKALKARTILLK